MASAARAILARPNTEGRSMTVSRVILFGPVPSSPEVESLVDALRAGLRDLDGAGGQRLDVSYRGYTRDHTDSLLDVATEIDSIRPAVVVGWGYNCARV